MRELVLLAALMAIGCETVVECSRKGEPRTHDLGLVVVDTPRRAFLQLEGGMVGPDNQPLYGRAWGFIATGTCRRLADVCVGTCFPHAPEGGVLRTISSDGLHTSWYDVSQTNDAFSGIIVLDPRIAPDALDPPVVMVKYEGLSVDERELVVRTFLAARPHALGKSFLR